MTVGSFLRQAHVASPHHVGSAMKKAVLRDKTSLGFKKYKNVPFFHDLNYFLASVHYLKSETFKMK